MKNILFSLVFVLISSFGFANNSIVNPDKILGEILIIKVNKGLKTTFTYTFTDFDSFDKFEGKQFDKPENKEECVVSIKITVKMAGEEPGKIYSASVEAERVPCNEIRSKIKESKKIIKETLSEY